MNYNHYICSAFIMSLLMIPQRTIAQSNGQNHIVSQTMLDSLGSSTIKTVQYYDGLGRPDVLATGGLSTNGKYVYTKTDYNMLGNPVRIQFCDHNITEYVYSADGRRLKTIHRTSVPRSDMLSIGATASLSASETLSVDSADYIGNYVCDNGTPKRYLFDGGYMVLYTNTCAPRYFFKDHLGNNRVVTTLAGTAQQINNYYPYGGTTPISTEQGYQPYKYNDKEYDPMHGLNQYDYLARQYDPAIARFNSMDPLAEKYYHISPYTYCAGNPVKYVDPDGCNPIYDNIGNFLGTDDLGIQGNYYVMNKKYFTQGMSHFKVGEYAIFGNLSNEVKEKIESHYANLQSRPDYDGFVSFDEGILWAKEHPYALKQPTPDNTLYIDASQIDFGSISTNDFPIEGVTYPQNLFSPLNTLESIVNPKLLSSVYALGRVDMKLLDRTNGAVQIINNTATDYDWNSGGGIARNISISVNNALFQINPQVHGFKAYYYGVGHLRR